MESTVPPLAPPLGDVLRSFRAMMRINQEQASRWSGVVPATWSRWERGALTPGYRQEFRLRASEQATKELGEHATHWMRAFQTAYSALEAAQQ